MVKYKFYKDQKMIGTILILSAILFQVFAFVKVPFFTTLHSYTIGLVFGSFHLIFYCYVIGEGLRLLLGDKFVKPRWLKINRRTYWVVAFSFMLVTVAWGHYYSTVFKTQRNLLGGAVFGIAFKDDWWSHFTKTPWWEPTDWWGGISGALLFSILALIMTTTGTAIVATLFLAITVSLLITGKPYALYTKSLKRHHKTIIQTKQEIAPPPVLKQEMKQPLLQKTSQLKSASIAPIGHEQETTKEPNDNDLLRLQTGHQLKTATSDALHEAQVNTNQLPKSPLAAPLLNDVIKHDQNRLQAEIRSNVKKLTALFNDFNLAAQVHKTWVGPTLTKYLIEPSPGINLQKFHQIESNIKVTLAAVQIRIKLPIPGETMIGIEVPHVTRQNQKSLQHSLKKVVNINSKISDNKAQN